MYKIYLFVIKISKPKDLQVENCNLKGIDPNQFFADEEMKKAQEENNDLNKSDNYSLYPKSTNTRNGIDK